MRAYCFGAGGRGLKGRNALEGIKIIDAATLFAGPLAATVLGDFGAEVIKVEHPKGDPSRSHGYSKNGVGLWWKMLGRNKRCVTLNLSKPEGQGIFERLASKADVVIESFRPGTLERWNLGYERLSEINSGLILARVTGFGQRGPYRNRPGFGTLAESMSGFAHVTGQPDGPPTLPPFGLADGIAALATACATLIALRAPRCDGPRSGYRPRDHRADLHRPGTATHRLRPARCRPEKERQPLRQQRPAQHVQDEGRQVARRLDERPEHRRAGDAPRRSPGIHRRAVVRQGLRAGQARRRARRGGGILDLRAYPG